MHFFIFLFLCSFPFTRDTLKKWLKGPQTQTASGGGRALKFSLREHSSVGKEDVDQALSYGMSSRGQSPGHDEYYDSGYHSTFTRTCCFVSAGRDLGG